MTLISHFLAALNDALRHKKIMFKYPNSSKFILKFLNLLIDQGLIIGYSSFNVTNTKKKICSKQGLIVFFRYHKGRYNVLRGATPISKPSCLKFISCYNLKSIIFKHSSSVFFLSTNKGLISSNQANSFGIGGTLLAQFN